MTMFNPKNTVIHVYNNCEKIIFLKGPFGHTKVVHHG